MFQRFVLLISTLISLAPAAMATPVDFLNFTTKDAFIDFALRKMEASAQPTRKALPSRSRSEAESFQCDLFGASQPLAGMDASLNDLKQAFQAEPECQPYQADVQKVTDTAESLKSGFSSIVAALENGTSDAAQIAQLQNQTLSMVQQTQTVLGLLIPIAKGQVFSKQCQQKLYSKSHLVQSVSSWAMNLSPVILKIASLFPGGQLVGSLISGATSIVAGTLNAVATNDLEGRLDMSLRQNRVMTLNNVCQFFKVSKRFSYMVMSSGVNKDVVEKSMNIYIAELLKNAETIDAQAVQELRTYWTVSQDIQAAKNNIQKIEFAVPENSTFTQCVLGTPAKLAELSQQTKTVDQQLNQVFAQFQNLGLDDGGFSSIYTVAQISKAQTAMAQQILEIKNQVASQKMTVQMGLQQCQATTAEFGTYVSEMKDEFVSFLSIMMEQLNDRLQNDDQTNVQFQTVSQIWNQVEDIKSEISLLQTQAFQTSSALKSEINDSMTKLKYRLLIDNKSPVHDLILFLANRHRINKNEMNSLIETLRHQVFLILNEGKKTLGNAGGNIFATNAQEYSAKATLNLLDAPAIMENANVKALMCNSVKTILITYQSLLDEVKNIQQICGYIQNDLDLNSKRDLRDSCLGRYNGQQGQVVGTAPLFQQLATQVATAKTSEGLTLQSSVGVMQSKFLALNCSLF
jgi:hypothetical protein